MFPTHRGRSGDVSTLRSAYAHPTEHSVEKKVVRTGHCHDHHLIAATARHLQVNGRIWHEHGRYTSSGTMFRVRYRKRVTS